MAEAFKGADAIYAMIPPNFQEGNSNEYYKRIAQNLKSAITKAEVNRVVFLSSWGAHSDSGTGTIVGLYHAEQILNSLHNISITHLRACSMYYNLYNFMDMIKYEGIIGTNIQGEDKYLVYMISTINIQV